MKDEPRPAEAVRRRSWVGWCCSYCSAPLQEQPHALLCASEGRHFATLDGVHRLLPAERRRELQPYLELYQRVRRDEGWRATPGLPEAAPSDPHAAVWRARALRFRQALELLGQRVRAPWRVLDVGAGNGWASLRLLERGHQVAAVDLNLDAEDGLLAPNRFLDDPARLPRAEAEMEALPVEPGRFDVVLAAGALHHAPRLSRALVELRRVTRRDGWLLVLDSPVYRVREDGEAMVAARMKEQTRRYGVAVSRETQSGYLVFGELEAAFRSAGWALEVHGWPARLREAMRDALEVARHGRRTARFPLLLARREG